MPALLLQCIVGAAACSCRWSRDQPAVCCHQPAPSSWQSSRRTRARSLRFNHGCMKQSGLCLVILSILDASLHLSVYYTAGCVGACISRGHTGQHSRGILLFYYTNPSLLRCLSLNFLPHLKGLAVRLPCRNFEPSFVNSHTQ